MRQKIHGLFCPSCGRRGFEGLVGGGEYRGLQIGWPYVCGDCKEIFDAFVYGEARPTRFKDCKPTLPHPDTSAHRLEPGSRCTQELTLYGKVRNYKYDRLYAARLVEVELTRGEPKNYVAGYECQHGKRWDRSWHYRDRRIELDEDVWEWYGNERPERRGVAWSDVPTQPPQENAMHRYVRFYRDGDAMAISTNVTDEIEFQMLVPDALTDFLSAGSGGDTSRWLAGSLPLIVDLSCKLRGYKAPLVEEQRVLTAGKIPPRDSLLAASSEEATQYHPSTNGSGAVKESELVDVA